MKTFHERCAEPIVIRVVSYKVVPRFIEGIMNDSVKRSRLGEGYDHTLEFKCTLGREKLLPQTDLITNDVESDMSEICIPEVTRELDKYPVIKSNYMIENLGRTLRMTKKEYEGLDMGPFGK
ncbi:MAG TPA: hypothetical protein VJ485_00635 [archaeon]|nr:hypothetical protein [archaeon]